MRKASHQFLYQEHSTFEGLVCSSSSGLALTQVELLQVVRLRVFSYYGCSLARFFQSLLRCQVIVLTGLALPRMILELHSVHFVVVPTSDRIFVSRLPSLQFSLSLPRMKFWSSIFISLIVFARLPMIEFSYFRLLSLWFCLNLLRMKFWNSIL